LTLPMATREEGGRMTLQLFLRDKNDGVVLAWRAIFGASDPDVSISAGDLFTDEPADAVISPANSFGFMDGGIDLAYSFRFGWGVQDRLQQVIRDEHDGELPVGDAIIVETGDDSFPFCVSAPTMRVPMPVPTTANAFLAFRAALRAVKRHNAAAAQTGARRIERLLSPGLATAIGKMPHMRCARQMHAAWMAVVRGAAPSYRSIATAFEAHIALTDDDDSGQAGGA
jgi:O-acetyl-ADP-ribose deacetylase (regulator of RNase III)